MIMCPNLNNPDVAREFNELKEATSEAAAYHIWSLNNGNGIDKAPNGALSKLFLDLLDNFEGDRIKAIQAKAKTYGKAFLEWFGDWTKEDKTNVSKAVDINSEPLLNQIKHIENDGYFTNGDNIYHLESDELDTSIINQLSLKGVLIGEKINIEDFLSKFDIDLDFKWFDKLISVVDQLGVKIKFEQPIRKGVGGEFLGDTVTLYVSPDNPSFSHVLMHELLHAALHTILNADIETLSKEQLEARYSLEKLYEKFKKRKNIPSKFSNITDIHEFVSELSNQDFRDYLKYNNSLSLLWKKFIDAVKNLFNATHKNYDLCDFAIELLLDSDNLGKPIDNASLTLSNEAFSNIMNQINQEYSSAENGYNITTIGEHTVLYEKTKDGSRLIRVERYNSVEALQLERYVRRYNYTAAIPTTDWGDAIDSELQRQEGLQQYIKEKEQVYVNQKVYEFTTSNPHATHDEVEQFKLDTRHLFHVDLAKETLEQVKNKLQKALPITNSETGRLRQQFLEKFEKEMFDPEHASTMIRIVYNELLGIRVQDNVASVILDYIHTFLETEPIQTALRILDNGRGLSTPKLVRELIDVLSGKITVGSKTKAFKKFMSKFWKAFNDLLKCTIFLPFTTYKYIHNKRKGIEDTSLRNEEKNAILNDIASWFISNKELETIDKEQVIYDMSKWTVHGQDIDIKEDNVIQAIKRGIESRIKALKSTTNTNKDNKELEFLQDWVDDINTITDRVNRQVQNMIESGAIDKDDKESIANAKSELKKAYQQDQIKQFLINGIREIHNIAYRINDIRESDIKFTNFHTLMQIKSDIMGFYSTLVSQYVLQYTGYTDNLDFKEGGSQYDLIKSIRRALDSANVIFDSQLQRYTDYIVERIADLYIDIGDKERFKDNAKLWLRNKINNGNLNFLETLAGPAYASTSPIVRILDLYIREANTVVRQETQSRGKRLIALYDKAVPFLNKVTFGNYMRNFCEWDENGRPTGNFVSRYNIGLFEKRKYEAKMLLLKKHGATIDDETGEIAFKDNASRIAFLDDYDRARYDMGEVRRYLPDYYIAKRHILSNDTDELLTNIDSAIRKAQRGCIKTYEIDGNKIEVPITQNLSSSDRFNLEQLKRERRALSNPYEVEFDAAGNVVSIKEKTGDALRRALEIQRWNKFKSERINYKPNTVKFNQVREKLVDEYGESSPQVARFDYDYTTREATDDWYEKLRSESAPQLDEVEELKAKRMAILSTIEVKRGMYSNRYDFSKLSSSVFEELRRLETEISAKRITTKHSKEYTEFIKNRTTSVPIKKIGTDIPFLEAERQKIESLYPGDSAKMEELYFNKYFYTNEKGSIVPLSIFSLFSPSQISDINDDVPTGVFSEVDESSSMLADDRFDPNDDSKFQIDKTNKDYINPKYDEIMSNPETKAFYEELLKTMDEAWEMLPDIARGNKFQMPQRRDRSSHLITRLGSFKAIASNIFEVNENDIQFNEELTTRPDGTIVETIPIRWVKKLKDPTMISTDLIGSVVDFYEMACNFREKLAIAAMAEALKLQTMHSSTGVMETDQSSRLGTHISMFIYGRMVKGFSSTKKMSKTERVIAKTLMRLRNLTHSKLMVHNWVGVMKNFIDSFSAMCGEIFGGKYFTFSNYKTAMRHMSMEIADGSAFSVGKTNTRSWTAKAMLFNGVSGNTHEMFHNRNESRVRRVLQMGSMIEYNFVDYSFKGLATNMIYDGFRLVYNPSTGKLEFMNREQALYAYTKGGQGKDAGLRAFKESRVTLREAYNTSGLSFELKPEYLDIVRPYNEDLGRRSRKLEQRVASMIQERSGVINGTLNDIDRGKLNQNYVGALVMQMRGWMVAHLADNLKKGHDFARYSSDEDDFIDEESMRNLQRRGLTGPQLIEEDEDYAGMYNFATGTVENGAWRGLLKAYKHWAKDIKTSMIGADSDVKTLTDNERYQVRRNNAALLSITIIAALSYLFGVLAEGDDGDDKDWWKLFCYTSSVASANELASRTPLGFIPTVLDLINSVTVVKSLLDDGESITDLGGDIITMTLSLIFNGDSDNDNQFGYVKTGAYSDLPVGIKGNDEIEELIGVTKPSKTPVWLKDALKTSSMVPGLSELGLGNIYKNLSESGLKSKESYYYGQVFPTKILTYNAQLTNTKKKLAGLFWGLQKSGIIESEKSSTKHKY